MRFVSISLAFVVAIIVCHLPENAQAGAQFISLGFLPNGNDASGATAVSDANGIITVVGHANTQSQGNEAFIWTQAGGMVGLGRDFATAISADGKTVVGGDPLGTGWIWTAATGIANLGAGQPEGVSSDGSVICGDNNDVGYRWTAATGEVSLPVPPGVSGNYSPALAISANGQYITGQCASANTGFRAYRYDTTNGYIFQQAGTPGNTTDGGHAITPDGSAITGSADVSGNGIMGVWINGNLTYTAGLAGGYMHLIGEGISASDIVVGSSEQSPGSAFIWDAKDGARLLQSVLTTQYGLNLNGWSLTDATAITADGAAIVGVGIDPNGFNQAFLVVIPEPSSLAILTLGGAMLLRRRRTAAK